MVIRKEGDGNTRRFVQGGRARGWTRRKWEMRAFIKSDEERCGIAGREYARAGGIGARASGRKA